MTARADAMKFRQGLSITIRGGRISLDCHPSPERLSAGGIGRGTRVPPVSFWLAQALALAETHGRDTRATTLPETGMRPFVSVCGEKF